ncbi:hypothetical protein INR49_010050 [Caranx melampygus]|nr:hypothetical protein INR49_010050 [Caranx melampygus]
MASDNGLASLGVEGASAAAHALSLPAEAYGNDVEDFNYGTLLRLDCEKDYTEENTIFATRVQFFAIEIARNREGFNDAVYKAKSGRS